MCSENKSHRKGPILQLYNFLFTEMVAVNENNKLQNNIQNCEKFWRKKIGARSWFWSSPKSN